MLQFLRPESSYRDINASKTTGSGPTVKFKDYFHSFPVISDTTSNRYEQHNTTSDSYRDVTDNKTTENSPVLNILDNITTSLRTMNDALCRESERLKTFDRWPITFIDKNVLAQTGMYYIGPFDHVKCYFCEVEIGRWEVTDNPVTEHMRFSPNCPLLRRRSTNNIPLDAEALDRLLPPPSYDVCGRGEIVDIRPTAYAESSSHTVPNNSPSFLYPDHPEYAIETARLRSFAEWPRTMKQKPQELSEAGFFYTGMGDRVKCFSCGGGLKDWDESDDPWEQHALWLSNCPYLKLMKGKAYIDSVIEKYKTPKSERKEESSLKELSPIELQSLKTDNTFKEEKSEKEGFEEKKLQDDKLCKICYASEYDTAFLPCGHVVACAKCASSVTKCPLCRKPFTDVIRVYFS